MFETPILYLIFNRPDLTEITFLSICKLKPKKLFIAADGPRIGNINDEINCKLVREYVLSKIDWDCELETLFRDENMGCGKAVSTAITWFFMYVEKGIILEDDCLADYSFFFFCETLLERFRDNAKIFHINGSNHQYGIKRGFSDYYFSNLPHVWGWATWRRAWIHYDFSMLDLEKESRTLIFKKFAQLDLMKDVKNYLVDTWDVQWSYTLLKKQAIAVTPNLNLITNLGFNENATHTNYKIPNFIKYSQSGSIEKNILHPVRNKIFNSADNFTSKFVHKIHVIKWYDIWFLKINRFITFFLKNIKISL